jgi:hypothetical protein
MTIARCQHTVIPTRRNGEADNAFMQHTATKSRRSQEEAKICRCSSALYSLCDLTKSAEMQRIPPDTVIVKDGPHIRLFAEFAPFSRCLGTAGCAVGVCCVWVSDGCEVDGVLAVALVRSTLNWGRRSAQLQLRQPHTSRVRMPFAADCQTTPHHTALAECKTPNHHRPLCATARSIATATRHKAPTFPPTMNCCLELPCLGNTLAQVSAQRGSRHSGGGGNEGDVGIRVGR